MKQKVEQPSIQFDLNKVAKAFSEVLSNQTGMNVTFTFVPKVPE